MELNYFKDILFDSLNDWDQNIPEITENYTEHIIWIVMGDGSVFRIQCSKEDFNLFVPPES